MSRPAATIPPGIIYERPSCRPHLNWALTARTSDIMAAVIIASVGSARRSDVPISLVTWLANSPVKARNSNCSTGFR